MPAADLLKDRYGADPGRGLKHRHDLALPHAGERIRTTAPAGLGLLRRGSASIRYAVAVENPAFAAATGRGMASTGLHVQPRLAVGDVSARQATRSAAPAAVGATSPAQQMTTRSKRPAARYHQPKERHHPGSAIAGPLCHRRTVLSRIDTVERR